ncbi:MAG: hypothetical protein GYB35_16840 [Algicola sp.]|nr:hypothetical protein [Algicola sp.]
MNNIHLEPSKPEIRKAVDRNELLEYSRYILLKDLHIELYKIIKDKERTCRDNIFLLLRKQNNDKAIEHLGKLNSMRTEINDLNNTRDKFYAHLDPDYSNFLKGFKVNDYYKLFELIEKGIIILGLKAELMSSLESLTSRNDFKLAE